MFLLLLVNVIISQYGYQPYPQQNTFTLLRENTFCKNRGHESSGELSVADVLVIENPSRTVQACSQTVQHFRQTSMCSDTFFASPNQCACLRPGRECKEEASETGLSMYRLTVLGGQQTFGATCAGLQRQQCEANLSCYWKQVSCVQTQLAVVGQQPPYGSATPGAMMTHTGVMPGAAHGVMPGAAHGVIPGTAQGVIPGSSQGMIPGAANSMIPGQTIPGQPSQTFMQPPKLIAANAKCDEEIEEVSGQSTIMKLSPSMTLNDCQVQVRDMSMRGTCTSFFVYQEQEGIPSECVCVRNTGPDGMCDVDDHIPGYSVYQLKPADTGYYPQGNPAQPYAGHPGAQSYSQAGTLPYGTNAGPTGAYAPGYAAQPGVHIGATYGASPNGYQTTPGYGGPSNGFQTGYGTNPQTYPGRIGGQLSKSHDTSKPTSPTSATTILSILLFSFSLGVVAAACFICRERRKRNSQNLLFNEDNTRV